MTSENAMTEPVPPRDRTPAAPPSVLAITSELPWPLNTGGHLRTFHLMRCLAHRFSLRLITAEPFPPGPVEEVWAEHRIALHTAKVGPRRWWREALRVAGAAVRGEPYVFYRRHDRAAVRQALREELRRQPPDLVYLDHLDSLVFRPLLPRVPVVIDLHNIYSVLIRRTAEEQRPALRRLYLQREARLLEGVEEAVGRTADACLTVSAQDAEYFRGRGAEHVFVVPNGVDCSTYDRLPLGRRDGPPVFIYVGALTWPPNIHAVQFLAREVLPPVRQEIPTAVFRIVGRNPPAEVTALGELPGVEVAANVPDIIPPLREAHLLAVPLEAGGGTRLKILEAFAAGLPVVSTPIGCEGLDVVDGTHLVIVPREQFARAIVALLRDPARGEALAERARALARATYDWGMVGEAACAAVADTVARFHSGSARPAADKVASEQP
jgi:glycosyltransferase involved in cell wall biosynthesis